MFCKNCGQKIEDSSRFCENCGEKINLDINLTTEIDENKKFGKFTNRKKEKIIKCGNCEYIGVGEKARSNWAIVLAWICVLFAPFITIIYFLATWKYKCPKCKSTFLGIKDKEGKFVGQKGSKGNRAVLIVISIIAGIAIIGILSSIVLASLNSARSKAQDASIKANLSNIRAQAEIYWLSQSTNGEDGNYKGLCNDSYVIQSINSIRTVKDIDIVCKDNYEGYAISAPLSSGSYWCTDNSEFIGEISQNINSISCLSINNRNDNYNDSINTTQTLTGAEICARDIPNSTWDGESYLDNGSYRCDCKLGYEPNLTGTACITPDQNCNEQLPNTHSIGNNTCDCNSGYTWNEKRTACY